MRRKYVSIGNPITIREFEQFNAPLGWKRIDYLKKDLRENPSFRKKFTKSEREYIYRN